MNDSYPITMGKPSQKPVKHGVRLDNTMKKIVGAGYHFRIPPHAFTNVHGAIGAACALAEKHGLYISTLKNDDGALDVWTVENATHVQHR